MPQVCGKILLFAKIHEGHNVARLVVVVAFVCDPHLDTRNLYARGDEWKAGGKLVIILVKILGEEKMTVGIVVVGGD